MQRQQKLCQDRTEERAMNTISDNQQLIRSASEHIISTTNQNDVKDLTEQQKTNHVSAITPIERKTDTIQISQTGSELSRASSVTSGNDVAKPSTDMRSEEKRMSSGGIENVMARYKEAQSFMEQIASGSINSTA
jgi:hypothetical protein